MDMALTQRISRAQLWVEFLLLYAVLPVAMALFMPPSALFPVLFAFTALGVVLLHRTPGFHWSDLWQGAGRIDWRFVGLFTAATVIVAGLVSIVFLPGPLLGFMQANPILLLMIALLYPFLSALPQEVVFRPLFFRRYGAILPGLWPAVVLNAALFSLAHLMFWSWIVALMTFSGGLAFAWAYAVRGNFAMAVVLHALSGIVVFALGLGAFFYSGNIDRPF